VIQIHINIVFIQFSHAESQHFFKKIVRCIYKNHSKGVFFTFRASDLVKKLPRFTQNLYKTPRQKNNKRFLGKKNEAGGRKLTQDHSFYPILRHTGLMDSNGLKKRNYLEKKHTICKCSYHYNHHKLTLLLSNDVEKNPGPNKGNLNVATYNVQGCRDYKKLKRLCSQFQKRPFGVNWVLNLQETHLTDKKVLPYHWKWGDVQSPGSSNSSGVAILYNKSYFDEILGYGSDCEGRFCYLVASKIEETYLFLNPLI